MLAALLLLGVAAAETSSPAAGADRSAAELMDVVMWNREPIGGPFTLTDQDGRRRTDMDRVFRVVDVRTVAGDHPPPARLRGPGTPSDRRLRLLDVPPGLSLIHI